MATYVRVWICITVDTEDEKVMYCGTGPDADSARAAMHAEAEASLKDFDTEEPDRAVVARDYIEGHEELVVLPPFEAEIRL